LLPKDLSLSSTTGKLLQHPAKEMIGLRKKPAAAGGPIASGSQVEVLVECPMPAVLPAGKEGQGGGVLAVKTLLHGNQSVVVGYNISAGVGFASVSAELSTRGARTDKVVLPGLASAKSLQLRVFVDGCVASAPACPALPCPAVPVAALPSLLR
jgi:hypothetical protein